MNTDETFVNSQITESTSHNSLNNNHTSIFKSHSLKKCNDLRYILSCLHQNQRWFVIAIQLKVVKTFPMKTDSNFLIESTLIQIQGINLWFFVSGILQRDRNSDTLNPLTSFQVGFAFDVVHQIEIQATKNRPETFYQ